MQIARRLTTGFPVYLRIRFGRFFVNEVNTDLALMDQTDKTSIMPLKSSWSQREEKESPFVVLDLFHWKQKHPTGETRKVWQDLKRVFSFPSVLYTGNRLEIRKRLFRERVVGQLKLPPQGSGHSRDWDFQSSRITWTMLSDWLLGGPVWRQELDFIIIMDPFQSGIFYDANLYLNKTDPKSPNSVYICNRKYGTEIAPWLTWEMSWLWSHCGLQESHPLLE